MQHPTFNPPWKYNQSALGRHWHLIDLPIQWPGYNIISINDADGNLVINQFEEAAIDWFAFSDSVSNFQQQQDIHPIDGKLGPNTLKALQTYYDTNFDTLIAPIENNATPSNAANPLKTLGSDFTLLAPEQPTAEPQFFLPDSANAYEQSIVKLWNLYGGGIAKAAKTYNLSVITSLAVFQVESKRAYDPTTGLLIIRFEPHIFKRYTGRDVHAPHKKQSNEWQSLATAYEIDAEAALLSTSYGLPQLMGFNWKVTPFDSVHSMVAAFQNSCEAQIMGFFEFVAHNNLIDAIQNQHWTQFVSGYNGPGNVPTYTERLKRSLSVVNYYDQHLAFENQTGDLFERIA